LTEIAPEAFEGFIEKWRSVTASELSTSQSVLLDLSHLLGVKSPHATPEQDYMFERPITFLHGDGSTSAGRIDLYRRGCFVLESKKLKAPAGAARHAGRVGSRPPAGRALHQAPAGSRSRDGAIGSQAAARVTAAARRSIRSAGR
jgi:hypothetical protein